MDEFDQLMQRFGAPAPGAQSPTPGLGQQPNEVDDLLGKFAEPQQAPEQGGGIMDTISGYMPSMPSVGDVASKFSLDTIEGPARNFLAGFNNRVAEALALPGATVDAALQQIGIDLFEGRSPDQTGLNMFKSAFNQAGVSTTPEEGSTMGKIGGASVDALINTAAIIAAAPAIAATKGTTATGDVIRTISDFVTKNPALFAFGEQAAVPGTVIGTDKGADIGGAVAPWVGGTEEAGRAAGGVLGGALGGTVTGGLLTPNALLRRRKVDAFDEAINPNGNPADIPRFAEEQIAGDLMKVDDDIARAIRYVQSDNPAPEAGALLRRGLEDARRSARVAEDRFYARIPKEAEIDATALRNTIMEIRNDTITGGNPDAYPGKLADLIMKETAKGKTITVKRLLGIRSALLEKSSRLEADGKLAAARQMGRIEGQIVDVIAEQLGDDVSVQQARNFSKALNDRFTRGPVAEVLASGKNRGPLVDPARTTEALLRKYGGGKAVSNVAMGVPGDAATAAPQLMARFEDGVRAEFAQDLALAANPEKAEQAARAFITKNRATLNELASGGEDLDKALVDLQAGIARRKEISKSGLAKMSKMSPDKAITTIFQAPNPKKAAEALVKRMVDAGDEDALDGLRTGVLERLIGSALNTKGTLSPDKLKNLLDPRMNADSVEVYRSVLSPTQFRDLTQLSRDAVLAQGGKTTQSKFQAYSLIGRIVGGMVGRQAHRVTGFGGTLQSQQIAAKLGGDWAEETFKRIPVDELLATAITDPRMARLIAGRVPNTPAELKALARNVRAITSGFRGAQQLTQEPR